MSRWLCAILLAASLPCAAAPSISAEEDVGRYTAEKGLFNRIGEAGHQVVDNVVDKAIDHAGAVRDRASDLVGHALGFLGVPYRRGGNSATTGFDCSGFVKAIYEQTFGLTLPRLAKEQAAATQTIDRKDLQPGDLVFFNTMRRAFSHVGIYVGDGKFVHAPKPGAKVRVEDMGGSYWARRFDGARRVPGGGDAAAVPGQ